MQSVESTPYIPFQYTARDHLPAFATAAAYFILIKSSIPEARKSAIQFLNGRRGINSLTVISAAFGTLILERLKHSTLPKILPLKSLHGILSAVRENSAVIFDLDDVIVVPSILWLWNGKFVKSLPARPPLEKLREPRQFCFVDPQTPQLFKSLYKKNISIYALTGHEEEDEALRTFFKVNNIFFHKIIYCNGVPKGTALFKAIDPPPHALFVDDRLKNCEEVYQACQAHHVPCTTYHYEAAKSFFNWELATFQYHLWKTQGELLSDEEAKKRYASSSKK